MQKDTRYRSLFKALSWCLSGIVAKIIIVFILFGQVIIKAQKPIFFDPYARNHKTGSFIIIDELTNVTVGVGIIWYPSAALPETENSI